MCPYLFQELTLHRSSSYVLLLTRDFLAADRMVYLGPTNVIKLGKLEKEVHSLGGVDLGKFKQIWIFTVFYVILHKEDIFLYLKTTTTTIF